MFTGLIERVGTLAAREERDAGRELEIRVDADFTDTLRPGDSVAVDGACLTVAGTAAASFRVTVVPATLALTTLAALLPGAAVNLERALRFGDRLGGHLVQGHVNGIGTVAAAVGHGDEVVLDVDMPPVVAEVTVAGGSIAVNGVSLTVQALTAADRFRCALVPFTRSHTNLGRLRPGDAVNLEGDMLGRFVIHQLKRRTSDGV